MQFRARVLDAQQRIDTVRLEAIGPAEARKELLQQGLKVMSLDAERASAAWGASRGKTFSLVLFAQELLALLQAGLSVIESVDALLEKDSSPASRLVLQQLAQDLRSGHKLSVALQRQPSTFAPLFVGLVGAAERTSNLTEALTRFIEYQTRVDSVRAKVVSASVYPAILMLVGAAVTVFLLSYVVPKFALVYQGTGRALPWASQLLIQWGRYAAEHAVPLAVTAALVVTALVFGVLRARRTGALGAAIKRLPWVGDRLRQMEVARLYLTLGLLLEGGMSIGQALQLLRSVGAPADRERMDRVRATVSEGQPLSKALEKEALTMPVAARLLKVGEETGQLGTMLRRAALFHEGETARWIERFTRAFEPVLMAVIGLVIGLIVLLLYMPIFDLAGSFQ
ncbi:type II secretion system F family protein [Ideonella sp. DXS29W]|uniref:Type II secretion system F family protein n=1 Tax=Ideonella lacteola TaxID=2984193 RepID=A0ABU9BRK3_9BURK